MWIALFAVFLVVFVSFSEVIFSIIAEACFFLAETLVRIFPIFFWMIVWLMIAAINLVQRIKRRTWIAIACTSMIVLCAIIAWMIGPI